MKVKSECLAKKAAPPRGELKSKKIAKVQIKAKSKFLAKKVAPPRGKLKIKKITKATENKVVPPRGEPQTPSRRRKWHSPLSSSPMHFAKLSRREGTSGRGDCERVGHISFVGVKREVKT